MDDRVRHLLSVMNDPGLMVSPETELICDQINAMDGQALDIVLCQFRQAASADGYDDDSIGGFWFVMNLPVPAAPPEEPQP